MAHHYQRVICQLFLKHPPTVFRTACTSFTIRPKIVHWNSHHTNKAAATTKRWYQVSTVRLDNDEKPTSAVVESSTPNDSTTAPATDDDYVTQHKEGLLDATVPEYQNPLHHYASFAPENNKIFKEDFGPDEVMPEIPLPPFSDDPNDVGAPPHIHALADEIVNLTMLEMTELITKLQDHFGIDDADYGDGGGGGGNSAEKEEAPKVEEKTIFDLKLASYDAKAKIKVIKEVRAITGLGLKEAKELVEGAPKVIQKDIKKEEAEKLKVVLEAAGATVEIV